MLETTRLTVSIQIVSHVLAYTNLCIANPILYNCFSENFRKSFLKVSIITYQSIEIPLTLSHYLHCGCYELREWKVKINLILISSKLVNSNCVFTLFRISCVKEFPRPWKAFSFHILCVMGYAYISKLGNFPAYSQNWNWFLPLFSSSCFHYEEFFFEICHAVSLFKFWKVELKRLKTRF